MTHIYNNEFTQNQIAETKKQIRKSIFFLILCVDKNTCSEYEYIDVRRAFDDLLYKIGGLNELLFCPKELVMAMSLLQSAKNIYTGDNFSYQKYKKLVLDAGVEIGKIKEV